MSDIVCCTEAKTTVLRTTPSSNNLLMLGTDMKKDNGWIKVIAYTEYILTCFSSVVLHKNYGSWLNMALHNETKDWDRLNY